MSKKQKNTPLPNPTYEHYIMDEIYDVSLNSPYIHIFTPEKQKMWENNIRNGQVDSDNILKDVLLQPNIEKLTFNDKKYDKYIILDFHNVFDSDIVNFIKQCLVWKTKGYAIHICSFVGRGGSLHAQILSVFSDSRVRQSVDSLWLVFDRKSPKKGKGHVIKKILEHTCVDCYFVDDGVENLKNVEIFKIPDLKLVHYVKCKEDEETPSYAIRISNLDDLVKLIET